MGFGLSNGCVRLLGGETEDSLAAKRPGLAGGVSGIPQVASINIVSGTGFAVRCFWSPQGKLLRKEERGPLGQSVWTYSFDDRGHLLEARKDGIAVERYTYDESSRRTADHLAWLKEPRQFIYYYDGSLIRLDDEYLAWTEKGQLKSIYDKGRCCEYAYGSDTRLDSVFLPSGKVIVYEYGRELMPVRVTEDNEVVVEHEWEDLLRLTRSIDIRNGLVYTFSYGKGRAPESVTITGRPDAVRTATGIYTERLALHVGVDQVDSIRVLATPDGRPVKYVEYDSFGNLTRDTRPELRFPLGFACGLGDPYTGFVRFGFRDYHPLVGRFTAKDPICYVGGDNDLWDYCVDDPVSCIDPLGLWDQKTFDESKVTRDEKGQFASSGGKNGVVGRQLGLGASAVIDGMADVLDAAASPARWMLNFGNDLLGGDPEYFKPLRGTITGSLGLPKPETPQEYINYQLQEGIASILAGGAAAGTKAGGKALEAIAKGLESTPTVLRAAGAISKEASRKAAAGAAALGKGLKEVPEAYTELGQRGGAALASRNMDRAANIAGQIVEGYAVPMAATPGSLGGRLGVAVKGTVDWLEDTVMKNR